MRRGESQTLKEIDHEKHEKHERSGNMEITINDVQAAKVVEIAGDLDGNTAPEAQARIQPHARQDAKIVLDMSKVPYMSSAGLRMLLVLYRSIAGSGGKVVLVGLSGELEDTMRLTGFLDFFAHYATLDDGIAAIA
jgi:anti-sigma B factor antagonist